jgi:excisionase family DNA binding protein
VTTIRPVVAPSTLLLQPAEVAERLGVPVSWVYAECRAGRMPHVRLGRYVRVRSEALDAWVVALEAGSLKGAWRRYAEVLPGSGPGGSPTLLCCQGRLR